MAEVNVSIAGRTYRMACDDGEEERLQALAARLDRKIADLRGHFGEIGDGRITVMAALTLADELGDAERRLAERERAAVREAEAAATVAEAVALALDGMAGRIEGLADRLKDRSG